MKKKGPKEWLHPERRAAVYERLVLQQTELPNWMALRKPDSPSALKENHSECEDAQSLGVQSGVTV